ncbi:hypothetical protein HELRODRAFT_169351 [Helobdella robusta]|uniref:Antistasin-like domain-containing protein n=1 Tax=Helobdella robusta TaxID=6412 RepID=T1F1T7_HELRO|nr:hypothetical protein HELRODRAFT_169351 [Helobdella robusta]ESO08495.1 hypothetical protein HELRODRAFT_169351 [Helobdella robusta]
MKCLYGVKVDGHGCLTCLCFDPCEKFPCQENEWCHVVPTLCDILPCKYTLQCLNKCPPLLCRFYCPRGLMREENGCFRCKCLGDQKPSGDKMELMEFQDDMMNLAER